MSNSAENIPEAADLICEIALAVNKAQDDIRDAEANFQEARRLDGIHKLGQTTLADFRSDLEGARKRYQEHDDLMPNLSKLDFNPFAAPTVKIEGEEAGYIAPSEVVSRLWENIAAARRLALTDNLKWQSPLEFDCRNTARRIYGDPRKQEFLNRIKGSVIVTLGRGLSPDISPNQEPEIYLVGDVEERCAGKGYPNPSFKVISLLPARLDEPGKITSQYRLEQIIRGREVIDAEQLGLVSNCYFAERSFYGPFEHAYGHTLGYICDELGTVSAALAQSGNPADIHIKEPRTPADHLVKLTLERRSLLTLSSA
jgi:hypothetical protein